MERAGNTRPYRTPSVILNLIIATERKRRNIENNRPRGREKNVTGPGKGVHKRGSGLGTGPVGEAGGYAERKEQRQSAGARSGGSRGGSKLIALLLALLLGGGGGLFALQGGQQSQPAPSGGQPSAGTQQSQGGQGSGWASLLGGLNAGSTSSGWKLQPNTGRLDTTVAPEARDKYTKLLGNGKDTVTIMVYMCGTDLESRAGMGTSDLQEMLGAKFGDNINLLVYTGGCKGWKNSAVSSAVNQIWQVKDGKLVCLQKDLGAVSMTDPGILAGYISELLGLVLGSGFFSDRSMDMEQAARYLADHHLDDRELIWQDSGKGDGSAVLRLSEEQWSLVHTLELNVFCNDGEGFIDLGLDNVYEFDEDGALKGEYDGT